MAPSITLARPSLMLLATSTTLMFFSYSLEKIKNVKPNIICIPYQFSINASLCDDLISNILSNFSDIKIIIGGHHITTQYEKTLNALHNNNVIAVIGEGEETIVELTDAIANDLDLKNVKGIAYMDNEVLVKTEPRELIKDLDSLPFPLMDSLPMELYFRASKMKRHPRQLYTYNDKWANIFTSRGCPMNCIFCSIHKTMGRGWRSRSPENVVDEIERDFDKFGIRHFNIEDDNMTLDTNRFIKICNLIVERGLDITWSAPNGIRADTLTEELVIAMARSGCKRVFVAPESGSQRVLNEIIDKKMDLSKIEKAVKLLHKHNIIVDLSFVIGLPGETKEEILQSIHYAKKLKDIGVSECGFNIATPLYGTRLYDVVVSSGYIDSNINTDIMSPSEALYDTPEWTAKELMQLQHFAGWFVDLCWWKKILYFAKYPTRLGYIFKFYINKRGRVNAI